MNDTDMGDLNFYSKGDRSYPDEVEKFREKNTRDTITLDNQRNSPFLRLPAELRNSIYEYIFSNGTIQIGAPAYVSRKTDGPSRQQNGTLALQHSCSQIRHEAQPVFYSLTTFNIGNRGIDEALLNKLGVEAYSAIQSIDLGESLYHLFTMFFFHYTVFEKPIKTTMPGAKLVKLKHVHILRENVASVNVGPGTFFRQMVTFACGKEDLEIHVHQSQVKRS